MVMLCVVPTVSNLVNQILFSVIFLAVLVILLVLARYTKVINSISKSRIIKSSTLVGELIVPWGRDFLYKC